MGSASKLEPASSELLDGLSCFPDMNDRYSGVSHDPLPLWRGYDNTALRALRECRVRKFHHQIPSKSKNIPVPWLGIENPPATLGPGETSCPEFPVLHPDLQSPLARSSLKVRRVRFCTPRKLRRLCPVPPPLLHASHLRPSGTAEGIKWKPPKHEKLRRISRLRPTTENDETTLRPKAPPRKRGTSTNAGI